MFLSQNITDGLLLHTARSTNARAVRKTTRSFLIPLSLVAVAIPLSLPEPSREGRSQKRQLVIMLLPLVGSGKQKVQTRSARSDYARWTAANSACPQHCTTYAVAHLASHDLPWQGRVHP